MGEAKRRAERMTPHERAIQEVTRKLIDQGKLIEAGWAGLAAVWLPADAHPQQVADLRKAFMAGAQHTWASFMTMLEPGEDPTTADFARNHYPTKGSA